MKITGIALMMTVSVMIANYMGGRVQRRVALLEKLILMIKRIKTYIEYEKLPLLQIMAKLENDDSLSELSFVSEMGRHIRKGEDFFNSWCNSVNEYGRSRGLDKSDAVLLCDFAQVLGNSDVKGQLENCETYISIIDSRLDSLRPKAKSNLKVCNAVGILVGSFLAIILI